MNNENYKSFVNKVTNLMSISAIIWIFIIVYQFFAGLITLLFGYGLLTWGIMIYNIVNVVKYFKKISYLKKNGPTMKPERFIYKFESDIPVCWLFMFINFFCGGFLGFAGNLFDLIIDYYVKGQKINFCSAENTKIEENGVN